MKQSSPPGSQLAVIEVDLRSGINLTDPPIDLMQGQKVRLQYAQNAIWQPRYANAANPARQALAFPVVPLDVRTYTFSGTVPQYVIGYIPFPSLQRRNLIVTIQDGTPNIQVWLAGTGTVTLQTILGGTSQITANQSTPIVQAWWRPANLNVEARDLDGDTIDDHTAVTGSQNGIMFFSHQDSTHIYYIDNNGTSNTSAGTTNPGTPDLSKWFIRSYTNTNADTDKSRRMDPGSADPPPGATALIVHLDRLWMAKPEPNPTRYGRSTSIYFTDPLNWRMIRPENFIVIEDRIVAMASPSSGGIGVGGQAQLLFFGVDSISVLDGDPTQGNAFLRILANNIGVTNCHSVVETPYGVVILATDEQVYLIPPGAQRVIPIGDAIRANIKYNRTDNISAGQPPAQLFWHTPYVYLVMANTLESYMFDLSKPDNPKWWGPNTSDYNGKVIGENVPNNVDTISSNRTVFLTHAPVANVIHQVDLETRPVSLYAVGLSSNFTTGLFHVPGHRVSCDRVYIQRTRGELKAQITVTAWTTEGKFFPGTLYGHQFPTAVDPSTTDNITYPVVENYVFQNLPETDGFYFTVAGGNGEELFIQKMYVALRISPASW